MSDYKYCRSRGTESIEQSYAQPGRGDQSSGGEIDLDALEAVLIGGSRELIGEVRRLRALLDRDSTVAWLRRDHARRADIITTLSMRVEDAEAEVAGLLEEVEELAERELSLSVILTELEPEVERLRAEVERLRAVKALGERDHHRETLRRLRQR